MKSFSSIVFSSNKLIKNNTYNIYINTISGNSSNMGMNTRTDHRDGPRR